MIENPAWFAACIQHARGKVSSTPHPGPLLVRGGEGDQMDTRGPCCPVDQMTLSPLKSLSTTLLELLSAAARARIVSAQLRSIHFGFVCDPIQVRPEWTLWTHLADGIVHTFFVRAADDAVCHHRLRHAVLF